MLDHPSNPGFPTYWHARGYGLFAANPMGEKIFTEGKKTLNVTIEPGNSLVFRHRILILQRSGDGRRHRAAISRLHRVHSRHHASRDHRRRQHQRHPRPGGAGDRRSHRRRGLWRQRRARRCARGGGRRRAYDDYERFLAHGLDLVIIGSPSARPRRAGHCRGPARPARAGRKADRRHHRADRRAARGGRIAPASRSASASRIACSRTSTPPRRSSTPAQLGKPVLASGRVKWYRPPEYYRRLALARDVRARRRRRDDEPGDPHGGPAALDVRTGGARLRAHRDSRPSDRGRRHRGGDARVRERRARHRSRRPPPSIRASRRRIEADRRGRHDRDRARPRRQLRPAVRRREPGVVRGGRRQRQRVVGEGV